LHLGICRLLLGHDLNFGCVNLSLHMLTPDFSLVGLHTSADRLCGLSLDLLLCNLGLFSLHLLLLRCSYFRLSSTFQRVRCHLDVLIFQIHGHLYPNRFSLDNRYLLLNFLFLLGDCLFDYLICWRLLGSFLVLLNSLKSREVPANDTLSATVIIVPVELTLIFFMIPSETVVI
jgi:hypothetical protein